MDLRQDLANPQWISAPYIAPVVAPITNTGTMTGTFLAMNVVSAGSAQTGRADNTEAAVTSVTHADFDFTCTEKINHNYIDERYIGFYGGVAKAQMAIAKAGFTNIALAVETSVATGILDSSNITNLDASVTGTTLAAQIDAAVQALRLVPGVGKLQLVCSEYVWTTLILANSSVQDRLSKPANVVYNSDPNFKDAKMQVFAGEFGFAGVTLGNNTSWYTGVTKKAYCAIMPVLDLSKTELDEARVGAVINYDYPGFGGSPAVGTYYSDPRHAEAVDVWARTCYVEIEPKVARIIKIA